MTRVIPLLLLCAAPSLAQIILSGETTVLIDPREPAALQQAARDLVSDLGKVLGKPARLVDSAGHAGAVTLCVALQHNLPAAVSRPSGWETLHIRALANPWPGSPVKQALVLTGSDVRGAIYAVYHFSQHFLGIDPFWFWTDQTPRRMSSLRIPGETAITDGPPAFRYRGWFINDEDLLTGWKPGPDGIAPEAWEPLFEALLRLKGNMIVPGTFLFPDEPQVRAAGERGLVISQHHIEVLGLNTYRWPEDQPYSFTSNPETMISAWRNAVRGYSPGQEVIWTVGYRGRHDRAFWFDDPGAGSTDEERALTIRRAIDKQLDIVRAERPNPHFLMNAWIEAVPLVRQGFLKIPDGVTLVWPDNGHGIVRDEGTIARGHGVYYHTAMYNSAANQLTEMVPLERIQRELGRAARNGGTEYLLVNTSDLRPVVMTTRAVMELAWNAAPWIDAGRNEPQAFLEKWCREEFGDRAAPGVARYYQAYFAAPGRYGSEEARTLADNAYHTFARHILIDMISGKGLVPTRHQPLVKDIPGSATLMVNATREAEPRWAAARELAVKTAPLVPAERKPFFQSHVLTQLDIHEYSNRMLKLVAEARLVSDPAAKKKRIAAAIQELEAVLKALQAAEYGQWAGFYRRELFTNVRHTLALAKACAGHLDGKPLPADVPIEVRPADPYVELKAYQAKRRAPM